MLLAAWISISSIGVWEGLRLVVSGLRNHWGLERSSWITTAWWTSSHQNVAWQCLVPMEDSSVSRDGLTDCTYHVFGKDLVYGVIWYDRCRHDNHVDHRKICEVQVHVMAWWHRDDGVMWLAQINVAGLRSDRTLDYKTWHGFRVIIESLTAQHNIPYSYSSPLSYHVYDQLLSIPHSPRWHHLGSQGCKACEASYWQCRLSCF